MVPPHPLIQWSSFTEEDAPSSWICSLAVRGDGVPAKRSVLGLVPFLS